MTAQMTAAATEGESILGEAFVYPLNGPPKYQTYIGVFGTAQVNEDMMPGGGYRRDEFIPLSVTQTQTGFNPIAKSQLRRVSDGSIFRIDKIISKDALSYTLALKVLGSGKAAN